MTNGLTALRGELAALKWDERRTRKQFEKHGDEHVRLHQELMGETGLSSQQVAKLSRLVAQATYKAERRAYAIIYERRPKEAKRISFKFGMKRAVATMLKNDREWLADVRSRRLAVIQKIRELQRKPPGQK